jgi:7,8-dihydroneopterin aldolase/epimerase/oxygenase
MAIAEFRIARLALHGRHGVLEAERALGQRFFLDLEIAADVGDALATDDVGDTLHYGQVIKAATAAFNVRSFNLIEAAAAAVADDLLARFPAIVRVRVTVHKPSAPVAAIIEDLSATVERRRDDQGAP